MKKYKLLIYDCDGTLYPQFPVRIYMALHMIGFAVSQPMRWKELALVRRYRAKRSQCVGNRFSEQALCSILAKQYSMSETAVVQVIEHWMQQVPAKALSWVVDRPLQKIIQAQRQAGVGVAIYSDLPLGAKVTALGINVDACYSPVYGVTTVLKPSPELLQKILHEFQVEPKQALMIGDSPEKDGVCAANAGVDYFCLRGGKRSRRKLRHLLCQKTGIKEENGL